MSANLNPREVLQRSEVVDRLAAIEHERWSHWQRYVHDRCKQLPDGSLVIPAQLADRWERQIDTPFDKLSEEEKESDREQVREYLPVIVEALEVSRRQ